MLCPESDIAKDNPFASACPSSSINLILYPNQAYLRIRKGITSTSNILSHLNQIHKCRICTVNRRLYKLGKIKLYHSIYVNTSYRYQIQNSPIIYTNFNIKFTIVNIKDSLEWLHTNSNINFIKKMVFGVDHRMFYCSIFQTCHTPQNYHSTELFLSKGYAIPVLHKSQKLPWVNKITVYVEHVKNLDLLKIASFCGLKEFIIEFYIKNELDKLLSIGLKDLPIKRLSISFSKNLKTKFSLSRIKEIFSLKILATFQLHFIKRYSKENIYVIPCHTLMSMNQNKFLEYDFPIE
ncbi:hypothetical protein JA1_003503 [Spathaspora sp. JA1]|nr:hypothetical protein JA1_003503 [Spathaspora sp. JA1]